MMESVVVWLTVVHTAVLGYWLGSELVINSTYRYVCYRDDMPFAERSRLMDHVMDVDQHVRYALVLQAILGPMIAIVHGYIPGGDPIALSIGIFGLLWLSFVEAVHRLRQEPPGRILAAIDRASRYGLMAVLLAVATGLIGRAWPMPDWLRWKLALFAGVIACGVGIRFALIRHFNTWTVMARDGPSPDTNRTIKRIYARATSILVVLWAFIIAIAVLSVLKPGG